MQLLSTKNDLFSDAEIRYNRPCESPRWLQELRSNCLFGTIGYRGL
ncbi:MAG: hypothetical protein ACTSR3_01550 [Candidatus Helarchaeota archaeon]